MHAQNPANITFPNPTATPPNLTVDSYTRASTSINLLPGFKYGFVSGNATNLLNLNLSSNPGFVSSDYLGSGTHPDPDGCNNTPSTSGKLVAETNGSFYISASGAAVYNIPIIVSPGTKGVQPNLNLNYNSQTGLGILGTGWALNGLSSITRTCKTIMHDGLAGGVEMGTNDVFSIDGNRLFGLTGTYGQPGSTYYPESETFATITSYNTAGNGPETFEVKDKNGNTLQYGYTPESRLTGIADNTVLTWYLTKFSDEFGNYMTYTYKQYHGEIVIYRIDYTMNQGAGLAAYNSVEFNYTDLAERSSYYIKQREFRKTKLLKSVTSKAGNAIVRKYNMDYNWNKGTYLASVTETDANGNQLIPTTFCWGDPNDYAGIKSVQNADLFSNPADYLNLSSIAADLDGDGFSDYVCYNTGGAKRLRVMRNNFKDTYGTTSTDITFNTILDNQQLDISHHVLSSNVTDENQDNKQEVYTVFSDTYGYYTPLGKPVSQSYYILKVSSGAGINVTLEGSYHIPQYYINNSAAFYYDVSDYTGDGANDIVRMDPEKIYLTSSLNTYQYNFTSTTNCHARPFSFDSDAAREFIVFESMGPSYTRIKIVDYTGSGLAVAYSVDRNDVKASDFAYGDINGDGLDDLVFTDTLSNMFVCRGNGVSFLPPIRVDAYTPLAGAIKVVDINSDGKSDITVTSSTEHHTYYSIGDVIFKGGSYTGKFGSDSVYNVFYSKWVYDSQSGEMMSMSHTRKAEVKTGFKINTADLNGDGITDITSFDPTQQTTITNYIDGAVPQVIQKIETPLRKKIQVRYGNINTEFCVKTSGSKEQLYKKQSSTLYTSPLFSYKPSLNCVVLVKEFSGASYQVFHEKRYVYFDAVYHKAGRGFLGFEQTMVFDEATEVGTLSKNTFDAAYGISLPVESINGRFLSSMSNNLSTYALNNASLSSKNTSNFSIVPRNTHGYFTELLSSVKKDYLNSTQENSTFTYDLNAAGNVIFKSTDYGWTGQPIVKSSSTTNAYVLNHGSYKPLSQVTSRVQTGETGYGRRVDYTYDAQGHLISVINDQNIPGQTLTTAYSTFNDFGYATHIDVSAPDVPSRVSDKLYDATGRFVTKEINALSNFKEYAYENIYGNKAMERDITGLVISYKYDGLGRIARTILPNGAQNKVTYAWENPSGYAYDGGTPFGVYSVKTDIEAAGYSKVYYASNGEELRTETQDYEGQTVIADTKYNFIGWPYPMGITMEKTEPHYVSQAAYSLIRSDYETVFYRPLSQTTYTVNGGSPANTNIYSYTYYSAPSTDAVYTPATKEVVNQKTQSVVKLTNAAGQVTEVKNVYPGIQQKLAYEYNSNGQPKTITLTDQANPGQNIVQSFLYDGLGNRSQMIDPSLGTTTYAYNTIGELQQQAEPGGDFTFSYDNLGRLVTKTGSISGITNYQYVSSGNGKQLVEKIYGPNSTAEYKYDNFNRVTESSETVLASNKILKTNYAYDNYGRETQHTYPSGYLIKKTYNAFSTLVSITDKKDHLIWQLAGKDALGRIRDYGYGNGIHTKNTYNSLNYLIEIEHGNGSIHTQTYAYDPLTGNLTSRVFNNMITSTSLKENFEFDPLDRLKKSEQVDPSTSTQIQVNNTSFDVLGNITGKSDCGSMQYSAPGDPFRLTSVTGAGNTSFNTLNVQYNDLDKVSQVSEMGTNKQMDFVYGINDQRIKVDYSLGGTNQYTRHYGDNYEIEETATGYKEWTYITAPSGLCAVYYNNNGVKQLNYVLSDHLGSPVLLIKDVTTPTIVEEYAFDSWGRRRNPADWSYNNIPVAQHMIRGFTLHEMVDEFDLVNMNGRMYDAVFGRFVQPDNIIQDPDNTQNYNRYAYCFNNPLKFNDPTGHETVPGTEDALCTWYSNVGTAIYYANNPEYLGAYAPGSYAQYYGGNSVSVGGNDYNLNFNGSQDVSYQSIYTSSYVEPSSNSSLFNYIPVLGPALESGALLESGDYLGATASFGIAVFDILTLGEGTAASITTKELSAEISALSKAEILRIENAATRINKPITVVGSRANGTAGAYSDWDYLINDLNSKNWNTIKNSLPGSGSIIDNTPRNIDIFTGTLDVTKPYITIYPRPL